MPPSAPPEPLSQLVTKLIRPYVRGKPNLGLSIAVYQQGRATFCSYGRGAGSAVSTLRGSSIYEIGSVTKVFTALLLAEMTERGEVGLDDPVAAHLPAAADTPAGALTLRQLATHTAGLPEWPLSTRRLLRHAERQFEQITPADLYARLAAGRFRPPDGKPRYSSFGMGLLGLLLADDLGLSYDAALQARICRPLGLADTGVGPITAQDERLIPGYAASGKPAPAIAITGLAPAGALRSTPADLLRFLRANLADPTAATPLTRALALCWQPQITQGPLHMGLGWMITPLPGADAQIHWHNGATWAYSSYIGFVRERQLGVVVLSNYRPALPALLLGRIVDAIGFRLLTALAKSPTDQTPPLPDPHLPPP